MQKIDQNLLVLDLETSGVNPFRHEVLAVGLVPFTRPELSRTVYVRPVNEIAWSAYGKSNFERYSKAWEQNAISPCEACDRIEAFVRDTMPDRSATLVGHNVGFDQAFLRKLAFDGGREQLKGISHRAIDTHTLLFLLSAQNRLPTSALTSDGAFDHFAIRVDRAQRHTAEGDALATRELAARVLAMLLDPIDQDDRTSGQNDSRASGEQWGRRATST